MQAQRQLRSRVRTDWDGSGHAAWVGDRGASVGCEMNRPFPVTGSNERLALWAVFGLGFTMCAIVGIQPTSTSLGWLHPVTLIGIALGALAIVPVLLVLFGWTAPLTSAGQR
jgi:hypothetical protein